MNRDPQSIGRYEILGPIATGGMAEVLLARFEGAHGFERVVALKRVLPHLARDESFVQMFIDEARIVSELHHPNVVQVLELGQHEDELFMAMEYLEGEPLSGLLRRMRKRKTCLPAPLAAYIIAEAAAGLHAGHELKSIDGKSRELVHRDVSPQNLFITYDGGIKVIDFGIAKAADRVTRTQTGQLKGKQAYMSPEQTHAGALDRRSDIFSLGVVLWEVTVGRRLFERGSLLDTLQAIRACDVMPPSQLLPSYPEGLERIVMMALEKDAADRPATALALRSLLLEEAHTLGLSADPRAELGAFMQRHFEDRIAEKAAVIRSASEGASVQVVLAETDLSGELSPVRAPVAKTAKLEPEGFIGPPPTVRLPTHREPQRSKPFPWLWLGAGSLVLGALLALALLFSDRAPTDAPNVAALPTAPPIATGAPPAEPSPAEPSPPPVPRAIAIDIVTIPEGAELRVGGELRGVTPAVLELPAGSGPLTLELARDGYLTETETIDLDRDTRLRVTLRPVPRTRRHGRRRGTSTPPVTTPPPQTQTPDPPPFGRLD